jgi:hypothetical protein
LGGCGPVNVKVRVSSRGRPGRWTGSDPAGRPLRARVATASVRRGHVAFPGGTSKEALRPRTGLRSHRHHQHHRVGAPGQLERHETPDPRRSDAVKPLIQCVRPALAPRSHGTPSGDTPPTMPSARPRPPPGGRESELAIACCESTVSYGGTVRPCWPDNSIGGDRFRLRWSNQGKRAEGCGCDLVNPVTANQ